MYRHPASKTPTLFRLFSFKKDLSSDHESLLGDPEKQTTSYGTSPVSSPLPTPHPGKKPVTSILVTEVTLTPESDYDINPFDRLGSQSTSVVEEGRVGGQETLEEVEAAKFPMSVLLSIKRGYRHLQSKYILDKFPLICAIAIFIQLIAMSRLVATFNSYYESKPIITMMCSNAILNGLADTMAQTVTAVREKGVRNKKAVETQVENGNQDTIAMRIHDIDRKIPNTFARGELIPESKELPPPFDFERLSRFVAFGVLMAPLQFNWFKVLSRTFPVKDGAGIVPALKRVGCDQLMFAPVGLAAFFTFMTVAEGGGKEGLKRKFENVYVPALRSNYMVWPAVQLINFRVMPLQFQLPFVSTIGIFWTTYLSLTNSAADVADE